MDKEEIGWYYFADAVFIAWLLWCKKYEISIIWELWFGSLS